MNEGYSKYYNPGHNILELCNISVKQKSKMKLDKTKLNI